MTKSLQNLAEEKAYDILFELENEFNVNTGKLPEVYYVGKNFSLKKNGIDYSNYDDFYLIKKSKDSFLIPENNLIALGDLEEFKIAEEVGHFIHYNYLTEQDNWVDEFSLDAISEMIGFFCSKLIDEKRKSPFMGDQFLGKKSLNRIIETIKYVNTIGEVDNLIHQQGYSLGEKLYYKYLEGEIKKKEIKDIITNPLDSRGDAFYEFLELKYNKLK